MSSNKVVEKASGIIAAIENCGCTHCLSILKKGLVTNQDPTDEDEHPKVQLRNVQR